MASWVHEACTNPSVPPFIKNKLAQVTALFVRAEYPAGPDSASTLTQLNRHRQLSHLCFVPESAGELAVIQTEHLDDAQVEL